MHETTPGINSQKKSHSGPENRLGEPFSWQLTDHCCRICFSRVVVRKSDDGEKVWRCTGCGTEKKGAKASTICACGMKLKTGADAGVRCVVNTDKRPEFPAEITATMADRIAPPAS